MELFIAMIPIILTIMAIIAFKKVKIALPVGIVSAALISNGGNPIDAVVQMTQSLIGIFYDSEADNFLKINTWNVPIIVFLLLIGVFASLSRYMGASRAFTRKISKVVKTPRGAKLMTAMIGNSLFFDDYFNSLVTGEITKPINKKQKVTAAEMSHILDSCSGPSAGLMIISTWGAFLVGIIGTELIGTRFEYMTAVQVFLKAVPLQLYSILSIVSIYVIIIFNIKIMKMKKVADHIAATGEDISCSTKIGLPDPKDFGAKTKSLVLPIVTLLATTLFVLLHKANYEVSKMMEQHITLPLMYGGIAAVVVSVLFSLRYKVSKEEIKKSFETGFKEMFGAITILMMAWILADNVGALEIGNKIQAVFEESISSGSFPMMWMPVLVFITSLFIAFSTGSSWGAFGIMIPIAIPLADAIGTEAMLLALIGSSISGSILGDHSSPISDTTLLAATGAKCHLQSHFETQVPYAMTVGGIAAIGFIVFGATESLALTYLIVVSVLVGLVILYRLFNKKKEA